MHVRGLPECVGPIQETTESSVFTQRIELAGLQYYQDNLAEIANCKIIVQKSFQMLKSAVYVSPFEAIGCLLEVETGEFVIHREPGPHGRFGFSMPTHGLQ